MKHTLSLLILLAVLVGIVTPTYSAKVLPSHSKIYITPMNNGLDGFIKSEIFRKKLPLSVILKEAQSDYILTGTMVSKQGSQKWFHYLTGTAGTSDSAQGTISLIKTSNQSLVWSGDAGDRSIFWGMLKKKGERKVAQRLIAKLKKIIIK